MLSPASPESSSLRNISTPVTVVFTVAFRPTISTSSPTFTTPRSIRPDTTVPRPEIENTRSEEHTSELQSLMRNSYAVFCLKKQTRTRHTPTSRHTLVYRLLTELESC